MSKQRKSNKEIKKPKAASIKEKKHQQAAQKDESSITQFFKKPH